jgi:hypothetical protein
LSSQTHELGPILDEYQSEIRVARNSFFLWKQIHRLAAEREDVFAFLNRHARSWNLMLHGIQVTYLITLGRIFDNDKRSVSLKTLLKNFEDSGHLLTKTGLESRRVAQNNGVRPAYLDKYLLNVDELSESDVFRINVVAEDLSGVWKERYEDIRNKVIAHKDMDTLPKQDELFSQTNLDELEDIILRLSQIGEVIWHFYANGNRTTLSDHVCSDETQSQEDLGLLFGSLLDNRSN